MAELPPSSSDCTLSPLSAAAARADVAAVRSLLADGAAVEGDPGEIDTPLFRACDGDGPAEARLAIAELLIAAGGFTRRDCQGGATPLHAAARRGPAALVELLLRNGALFWQADADGRRPYHYALDGAPLDRDRILFLCAEGPKISDPDFRAAVVAVQSGDIAALERLLDAHPRLLHERAIEPDLGPKGYFSDPKLFWFIANNPTLVAQVPANIVDVARFMIARGVAQADLDYALELVMTNGNLPTEQQIAVVRTLVEAGAKASRGAVLMTLGHRQTAPIGWLLDRGLALDAACAAALGRNDDLEALLDGAPDGQRADALAMAVINGEREAARLCLEAGADPNRFMPVHSHSTPLHQAAVNGDVSILQLLVRHGARLDIKDTLWRGTPLGWAIHNKQREAEVYLRSLRNRPEPDFRP